MSNYFLWSEQNENAVWVKGGYTSPTVDAIAAPDTTVTADLATGVATSTALYFSQTVSGAPTGYATVSIYVKPNGFSDFGIRENTYNGYYVTFDLTGSGSIIETNVATGTVTSLANGWYRASITYTQATHASVVFVPMYSGYTSGNPMDYLGHSNTGSEGAYVWGAQFDSYSSLRTYQKTTSAVDTSDPVSNIVAWIKA
jgi:hypothetical protein